MAAQGVVASAPPIRIGALVVPLLALAVFINYVDRGNLATAAPLIKDELHLSASQIGLLVAAFYFSYTPGQLVSGWLAHRINPYRTLALGLCLWSVAMAASGLVAGFASLIVLRVVLGVGESAAFPCSSKLLAQHLPSSRLGAANGLIGMGLALGPAFGTWAGGDLMSAWGWRASFLVFGLVSLLWLVPWWAATRHVSRAEAADPAPSAVSFGRILCRLEAWGAALGHFCGNYCFYFVVSWLPLYLVKERGLSMSEMASLGGLIYLVYAASSLGFGALVDRWIVASGDENLARKTTMAFACLVPGVSLIVAGYADLNLAVACLFLSAIGFGAGTSTLFTIGQTLAGPRAAGKWMGVQNGLANIAGIIGPLITGWVIDRTGSFSAAFVIAGAASLVGLLGWLVMIRKVAPLEWS
jgi:MFS family permease